MYVVFMFEVDSDYNDEMIIYICVCAWVCE